MDAISLDRRNLGYERDDLALAPVGGELFGGGVDQVGCPAGRGGFEPG